MILRNIGILSLTTSICISAVSQTTHLDLSTAVSSLEDDSLKNSSSHRIPSAYVFYFEEAIACYPELKEVHIELRPSKIKTSANARPTAGSALFRKRTNRRYVIRINNSQQPGKVLFSQLDTAARIGLLGHEIGHILDYHKGKCGKIFARGFAYLSKKSKAKFEREIDRLTIQRGLGNQLYSFSYFVLFQSDAPEKYKQFKRRTYLTPEEIIELLK